MRNCILIEMGCYLTTNIERLIRIIMRNCNALSIIFFPLPKKPKRVFFDGAAIKKLGLGFLGVNNKVY